MIMMIVIIIIIIIIMIVSVLHQNEGGIGKSIPNARKIRGSREIWRAEGMDLPFSPEFRQTPAEDCSSGGQFNILYIYNI